MEDEVFDTGLGRKFLALIKASFKVSDLIPDLVLREKIKNQILNVYESFFSAEGLSAQAGEKNYSDLLKEIDVLDRFFFLAGQLNLVKENHLRILSNGFLVFKSRIILAMNEPPKAFGDSAIAPVAKIAKKEPVNSEPELSDRQKNILEKFSAKGGSPAGGQNKETLKLAEILEFFPGVSEKTVRNELSSLIGFKKITRSGQGGSSFYKVVR